MGIFATGDFILEFENENDQKEFEAVFQEYFQSWTTGDIDAFFDHTKNLIEFGYRGKELRDFQKDNRNEVIEFYKQFYNLFEFFRYFPEGGKARQYGNVVVIAGFYKEKTKLKDGQEIETNGRYSFTYIKQNGKWQQILAHRDTQFG